MTLENRSGPAWTVNLPFILYPIPFLYFHSLRVSFIALAHHLNSFHLEGLCPEHDRCSLLLLSFPSACVCKLLYRQHPLFPNPYVFGRSFIWMDVRTDGRTDGQTERQTDRQTLGRPGRCRCGCKWKTDGLGKRTSVSRAEPRHWVTSKCVLFN